MSKLSTRKEFELAEKYFLPEDELKQRRTWVVTGGAGFIGSHLAETLLKRGQKVTVVDNLSTGSKKNLEAVRKSVEPESWSSFSFVEGDIRDTTLMESVCAGADFVLHQAALGSVPRSVSDPLLSNEMNVSGFLSVLFAARKCGVQRVVYASSSAVYGDNSDEVKSEDRIGKSLSPYGASKRADEVYGDSFAAVYGQSLVGLRYFNVFGARQDPNGAYAAVIPRWSATLAGGGTCTIFGDGETSRDFCFVGNVVQANLRAAVSERKMANEIFNIAVGTTTSLTELYGSLSAILSEIRGDTAIRERKANYEPFRAGDIRHSLADISKAKSILGYQPSHTLVEGLKITLPEFAS